MVGGGGRSGGGGTSGAALSRCSSSRVSNRQGIARASGDIGRRPRTISRVLLVVMAAMVCTGSLSRPVYGHFGFLALAPRPDLVPHIPKDRDAGTSHGTARRCAPESRR